MSDLVIRPARAEELDAIWAMVVRAVADMNARGNPQWGADYPTRDFYAGDIGRGELYAALADGQLAGVACINTSESPEYDPLPWTTVRPAMVIHRMAVDPACQRSGIGAAFFHYLVQHFYHIVLFQFSHGFRQFFKIQHVLPP